MLYLFVLQVLVIIGYSAYTCYGLLMLQNKGRIDIVSRSLSLMTGYIPVTTIALITTFHGPFWSLYSIPVAAYILLHLVIMLSPCDPVVNKRDLLDTPSNLVFAGTALHVKNGKHLMNNIQALEGFISVQLLFAAIFAFITRNVMTSGIVLAGLNIAIFYIVQVYLNKLSAERQADAAVPDTNEQEPRSS